MKSELILVIHRDKKTYPKVLDQLSDEFDRSSYSGKNETMPSMFVCTKPVWIEIEGELVDKVNKRSKSNPRQSSYVPRGYDRVTSTTPKGTVEPPHGGGFNALTYRGRPVVAMDAGDDNIISARLKEV